MPDHAAALDRNFPDIANRHDRQFIDSAPAAPKEIPRPVLVMLCGIFIGFWLLPLSIALLGVVVAVFVISKIYIKERKTAAERVRFIRETPIPARLWQNKELKALDLPPEQQTLVSEGLKDFFLLNLLRPGRAISMPSKQVDKLWHAFILDTSRYEDYCRQAFGKTLHHIPDYAFAERASNARMYTYQAACRLHGINPAHANGRLPRLFAIDNAVGGTVLTAASAMLIHAALASQYQQWYESITGGQPDGSVDATYSDAEITCDGDSSCGSSGDGGCGGGCGGGGD